MTARREAARLAARQARRRLELVRAVIGRRVAYDARARLLGTVLSVVEPLLSAVEALLEDG